MKLIKNLRSPNFDVRKIKKIKFIIIHYTALKSSTEAISYLCDPKNRVSAHFLISQKGEIYNLVDENKRAWHAGLSYWDSFKDLNSLSIGIELDFSNSKNNNKYTKKLLYSLMKLIKYLKIKYNIKNTNILGHSDVAPYRKKDPGKKFPWKFLYKNNLAYQPLFNYNVEKIYLLKKWFLKNNIKSKKGTTTFVLSYIGYDTLSAKNKKELFRRLILAYQMHFMPNKVTGRIDDFTYKYVLNHFLNILLTKD